MIVALVISVLNQVSILFKTMIKVKRFIRNRDSSVAKNLKLKRNQEKLITWKTDKANIIVVFSSNEYNSTILRYTYYENPTLIKKKLRIFGQKASGCKVVSSTTTSAC